MDKLKFTRALRSKDWKTIWKVYQYVASSPRKRVEYRVENKIFANVKVRVSNTVRLAAYQGKVTKPGVA